MIGAGSVEGKEFFEDNILSGDLESYSGTVAAVSDKLMVFEAIMRPGDSA
jgi:hypothetical protein